MTDYPNERDCEHGSLRRACDTCEYEREITELKAEIETLKAERDDALFADPRACNPFNGGDGCRFLAEKQQEVRALEDERGLLTHQLLKAQQENGRLVRKIPTHSLSPAQVLQLKQERDELAVALDSAHEALRQAQPLARGLSAGNLEPWVLDGTVLATSWPLDAINAALREPLPSYATRFRLMQTVIEAAIDWDIWRHDPGTTDGYLDKLLDQLTAAIDALRAHELTERE